jgi:hypothetical protein
VIFLIGLSMLTFQIFAPPCRVLAMSAASHDACWAHDYLRAHNYPLLPTTPAAHREIVVQ